MASRDILKPKNPSRQELLDTIGDQGRGEWRNPVHLRAVTDGWPKHPETEDARENKRMSGMEKDITGKKGAVT